MNDSPISRTDKRLKPCPYCGNSPTLRQYNYNVFVVACERYVCDIPYSIVSMSSNEKRAIDDWNSMVNYVINRGYYEHMTITKWEGRNNKYREY